MIDRTLGLTARAIRGVKGMTQDRVCQQAREAGHTIHTPDLSRLERGVAPWSSERIAAVAAGLGVSPFLIMFTPDRLSPATGA